MSEDLTRFIGAVAPNLHDPEPRKGTRHFAVLASSPAEAENLVRAACGRPDADVIIHDDAASKAFAERMPLAARKPAEFNFDR